MKTRRKYYVTKKVRIFLIVFASAMQFFLSFSFCHTANELPEHYHQQRWSGIDSADCAIGPNPIAIVAAESTGWTSQSGSFVRRTNRFEIGQSENAHIQPETTRKSQETRSTEEIPRRGRNREIGTPNAKRPSRQRKIPTNWRASAKDCSFRDVRKFAIRSIGTELSDSSDSQKWFAEESENQRHGTFIYWHCLLSSLNTILGINCLFRTCLGEKIGQPNTRDG